MQVSEFTTKTSMVDEHGSTLLHENAKNESGKTPLDIARERGNSQIVTFLLEKGIDAKDERGWTPLHYAAYYGERGMISFLISKEADVNARDNSRNTPLHIAAKEGNYDSVEVLLENNADINAKNEQGKTPLDIARERGNSQIVTFLLERGIDAKDESSKTPLDIARERGNSQIITLLSSYQRENRQRDQVSDSSWMNNSIVNWFKGLMSSTESPSLLTSTEHNNHAVTPVPEINTTLVNSTIILGILTAGLLNKTQYRQSIPDNLLSPLEQSMKLNNVDGDRIKKDILQAAEKFGDPGTDMYEVEVSGNKTGMWK